MRAKWLWLKENIHSSKSLHCDIQIDWYEYQFTILSNIKCFDVSTRFNKFQLVYGLSLLMPTNKIMKFVKK